VSKEGRESRTEASEQQERTRRAGTETEASVDPRIDRARSEAAVKGTGARGNNAPSKDDRSRRETKGANADRGNKPPESDEDEDKKEDSDEETEFWEGLVGEAYRSRRRRGEWKIREND
jgi:hypothetical protein